MTSFFTDKNEEGLMMFMALIFSMNASAQDSEDAHPAPLMGAPSEDAYDASPTEAERDVPLALDVDRCKLVVMEPMFERGLEDVRSRYHQMQAEQPSKRRDKKEHERNLRELEHVLMRFSEQLRFVREALAMYHDRPDFQAHYRRLSFAECHALIQSL